MISIHLKVLVTPDYWYRDNWDPILGRGRMANNEADLNKTRSGVSFVMTTDSSNKNVGFGSRIRQFYRV